jgi:electron transport complex protein RnfG
MREGMKLALTLMLISAAAGLGLSWVNGLTAGRIVKQQEERLNGSLAKAFPAGHYEKLDKASSLRQREEFATVEAIWKAARPEGYVVSLAPRGYGGKLNCLVGITAAGTIRGVVVNQQNETPGLGSRVVEDSFLSQFKGVKAGKLLAVKKDGGTIQAVSGATVSSRALTRGVNTALAVFQEVSR